MVRARSGKTLTRGRKRTLKLTKGFRASRHNLYRQSIVTLIRSRVYAFRDRRVRKRDFRRLWIVRINAACRSRGFRYSLLISGLQHAGRGAEPQEPGGDRRVRSRDVYEDRGIGPRQPAEGGRQRLAFCPNKALGPVSAARGL